VAGQLPAWRTADLPEPLPFSIGNTLRTIGPGAILLVGAIGGGEWIVGPLTAVRHGSGILWIATVAIVLQVFFNLEAIRYTLYTGEPILTGIMRLKPGPRWWGGLYVLLALAQLGVPALAASCASVIFAAAAGRMAGAAGATNDATWLAVITSLLLVISALLLVSGRTVERVLERLAWIMVVLIFFFLLLINIVFVPLETWGRTVSGFAQFGYLPAEADWLLLGVFASLAGSGGIGNLIISNWFRDKGFAMGARVGAIGGLKGGSQVHLAPVGCVFPITVDNLRRWRLWWKYTLLDQVLLWGGGCFLGMLLNVNLAAAIIPATADLPDLAAGTYQAQHLATQLWRGFWALTLLNGFWILFSTHLGNTDTLVRLVCDTAWVAQPKVQRWPAGRVYAVLLAAFTVWGLIAVHWGSALNLLKLLGIVAAPTTAVAALQILRVNTKLLPVQLRPQWWRRAMLLACAAFYGSVFVALASDLIRKALRDGS
jgi:hypothetical protein